MNWHINGSLGEPANDLGEMTQGLGHPLRKVSESSVVTYAVQATADAGDGSVAGDVNATDFSAQLGTSHWEVLPSHVATVVHKGNAYLYVGPRNVRLGVGGDYTAQAADFAATGTVDHAQMTNRDVADAHPMSAIAGLDADQARQDQDLLDHEGAVDPHNQYLTTSRGDALYDRTSEVDSKVAQNSANDQAYTDQEVAASMSSHLGTADPHGQYLTQARGDARYYSQAQVDALLALFRAEALETFTQAGYGGLYKTTDTNYGTVGDGDWTTVDNWDDAMLFTPEGVTQDIAGNGIRFTRQGVWAVSMTLAVSFTDTNQGRVFGARAYNASAGSARAPIEFAVGRNQAGVNIAQASVLWEIGVPELNQLFQIQIAGIGDSFASCTVINATLSAHHVAEAQTYETS